MDIDKIIAEVERLDREATPGPWVSSADRAIVMTNYRDEGGAMTRDNFHANGTPKAIVRIGGAGTWDDCDLVALSRTAAPLLAAEVKRLRAGGCARDQRTTQFCAEAVARDADIAKLRDQILDYQQALHIAEQEIARLKRALVEPTEETGDPDSEQGEGVAL